MFSNGNISGSDTPQSMDLWQQETLAFMYNLKEPKVKNQNVFDFSEPKDIV